MDATSTGSVLRGGTHLELSSSDLPLRVLQGDDDWNDDKNQDDDKNRDDDDWVDNNNNNNNKNDKNNNRQTFPDDIYHCRDPDVIDDEFDKDRTVECDFDTHEWVLESLHEDKIPKHCKDVGWKFRGSVEDLQDWEEPCYLWTIMYGDLVPSMQRE